MRKIILYTAASLDSFIARNDGGIDWLNPPEFEIPGEDFGYAEFLSGIDTTLMGNNTYKVVLGFNIPFPYPDKTNYVFSRSSGTQDTEFVRFIKGDIAGFVRNLKHEEGKDIWLIGGGQINTLLLNHGLIDKIILTIIPVTLGKGIPLFGNDSMEVRFNLENSRVFPNGFVQLSLQSKI